MVYTFFLLTDKSKYIPKVFGKDQTTFSEIKSWVLVLELLVTSYFQLVVTFRKCMM